MAKKKSVTAKKKKDLGLVPEDPTMPADEPVEEPGLPTEAVVLDEVLGFEDAIAALDEELAELGESPNGMIRIVDDVGHLLCMFNPVTKAIEIKPPVGRSSDKGKLFAIDVIQLSNIGVQNILRSVPVSEIKAKLLGG